MRFAQHGEAGLVVISMPTDLAPGGDILECFGLPVAKREGGLLLAVPMKAIDEHALIQAIQVDDESLLGPNKLFEADLVEEDEGGALSAVGRKVKFFVVDFADDILAFCREYEAAADDVETFIPFDAGNIYAIPNVVGLFEKVQEWAASIAGDSARVAFYSAREEPAPSPKAATPKKANPKKFTNAQLSERLETMAMQLQLLTKAQPAAVPPGDPTQAQPAAPAFGGIPPGPKVPRLSDGLGLGTPNLADVAKAASVLGPPPRARGALPVPKLPQRVPVPLPENEAFDVFQTGTDPMIAAIAQQGAALTALVSHLTSSSDPLGDFGTGGGSSSSSTSTRGLQRRERMQAELAAGTSSYFFQMQQQLCRKMNPSHPVPRSEEEINNSEVSLLAFMEKYGGFRHQRTLGIVLWMLGHAVDNAARGDLHRTREHLALTVCAIDQAASDQGDWGLAFLLSLVQEPPINVFMERQQSVASHQRTFGPLVPASWAATSVAFLKEMEVLATRKAETKKAAPQPEDAEESSPSPKRRPRFPKRPKGPKALKDK